MDFEELRDNWDRLGARDPMWAVLTWKGREDGKWNADEFFRTGEHELANWGEVLATAGVSLSARRALDFGCGLGRIAEALCLHVDHYLGVDLAASMIAGARLYNRLGARANFEWNEREDLSRYCDASFELVYTCYVLQHMHPTYSERYLKEFARVLAPGGILLAQVATDFRVPAIEDDPQQVRTPLSGSASLWLVQGGFVHAPRRLTTYELVTPLIRLANQGRRAIPSLANPTNGERIALLGHWRSRSAEGPLPQATLLPRDLGPGETSDVPLRICAPGEPGSYEFEVLLATTSATGFRILATIARCVVEVVAKRAPGLPEPNGTIEMFCLPRARVRAVAAMVGLELLAARDDDSGGPNFVATRYCFRKRG